MQLEGPGHRHCDLCYVLICVELCDNLCYGKVFGASLLADKCMGTSEVFFSFGRLGRAMLGRDRSIGRSDGMTSLTLDFVLVCFSEVPICICLNYVV